jgi:hypothetical protein
MGRLLEAQPRCHGFYAALAAEEDGGAREQELIQPLPRCAPEAAAESAAQLAGRAMQQPSQLRSGKLSLCCRGLQRVQVRTTASAVASTPAAGL